jgi:hypothetical protein
VNGNSFTVDLDQAGGLFTLQWAKIKKGHQSLNWWPSGESGP